MATITRVGLFVKFMFFLFIYKLAPLYGILIAFKDYNIFLGSNPIDAIGLNTSGACSPVPNLRKCWPTR